jgi:dTDP-4-amino-4,6-dideoxygalactose transaminase
MYREMLSAQPSNLPIAYKASQKELCLLIYPALDKHDLERITNAVRAN